MPNLYEVETARLLLRQFREEELDSYHERIFNDPRVMAFLPPGRPVPKARTAAWVARCKTHWERYGFGVWAVEERASGELIGHCGLGALEEIPEVEVLYALAPAHWGKGLATEAARASVRFGFEQAGLSRIIALAFPNNVGSRRVMEHAGLRYVKDTYLFDHDLVYYEIERGEFKADSGEYRVTVLFRQEEAG